MIIHSRRPLVTLCPCFVSLRQRGLQFANRHLNEGNSVMHVWNLIADLQKVAKELAKGPKASID